MSVLRFLFIFMGRGVFYALLALLALMLLYRFVPPVSTLMLWRWATLETAHRDYVPLTKISSSLQRAVLTAEDARFCDHHGIDWQAVADAIEEADEDGPARGASTISMQVAKNLFLWHGRSYIRKAIEMPLALALDALWPKRRMLEVYLNIAEWGDGVFGAEAAARHYFKKSASQLTEMEAAQLAASLPNPVKRNPLRTSAGYQKRTAMILGRMHKGGADRSCLR